MNDPFLLNTESVLRALSISLFYVTNSDSIALINVFISTFVILSKRPTLTNSSDSATNLEFRI